MRNPMVSALGRVVATAIVLVGLLVDGVPSSSAAVCSEQILVVAGSSPAPPGDSSIVNALE